VIAIKWVFRSKLDESRVVVGNKVILIAKGYNQEEGIEFDETFIAVAGLEAIHKFLTFASHMASNYFKWMSNVSS